jgi:uncharacterized protein YgbK (DUF1537 family)
MVGSSEQVQCVPKIVVIDDDPTGSQTVHSCPLLLRWDVQTLRRGLRHPSPLLFVLANTRALLPEAAAARNREIVDSLEQAFAAEGISDQQLLLVSRGDSTLRGHGVLEPAVLAEELGHRFGPVQATLHVPAFLPGGRTTVNGVHLLHGWRRRAMEPFRLVPCCGCRESCWIVLQLKGVEITLPMAPTVSQSLWAGSRGLMAIAQ